MKRSLLLSMIALSICVGYISPNTMMYYQSDAIAFQEAILGRTTLTDRNFTVMIDGGSMGIFYSFDLHTEQPQELNDPIVISVIMACGEVSLGTDWVSRGLNINFDEYGQWAYCTTEFCREFFLNMEEWNENTISDQLEQNVDSNFPRS